MADDDSGSTVSQFSEEEIYACDGEGSLVIQRTKGKELRLDGEAEAGKAAKEVSEYDGQRFGEHRGMEKYWAQRYKLWSKFDEGVWMDEEMWYSVTPEQIAVHIAERCKAVKHDVIIDAFSGAGGNTIQFAKIAKQVIAIDIDPVKLQIARHNAQVYGVAHKIEYIQGDYTKLLPHLEADIVFLSPPWGGPLYNEAAYFDLSDIQLDPSNAVRYDGFDVFDATRKYVSKNIIYYLPRNLLAEQVVNLAPRGEKVEVEKNIINEKVKAISVYYGDFPARSKNKRQENAERTTFPAGLVRAAFREAVSSAGKKRKRDWD
eukprot:TRINITY_DN26206_c0_g1_i1.p1 TRINITY_DN26206_c0_g1~~TRINITY_DN26206_c0_g1_i1.p1  ORF type:complete len:336 (+),score=112.20 TRINITY_DN26206_c0_g1_i1:59-1009(+)